MKGGLIDILSILRCVFRFIGGGQQIKSRRGFCWSDLVFGSALLVISTFLRFYRIKDPANVVFDELHFTTFAEQYHDGKFFFDIHPAYGRIFHYTASKMLGHDFKCVPRVGESFGNCTYLKLRIPPAVCGSFCSPILYAGIRVLGCSPLVSFACAFQISCDGSFIIHSRYALIDAILQLHTAISLLTLFVIDRCPEFSKSWFLTVVLNGIFVGLTCCIKNTALGLLAMCAFWSFFATKSFRAFITRLFTLCFSYAFIHCAFTIIHVILLPYHGPDEKQFSNNFSSYLTYIGDPKYRQTVSTWTYIKSIFVRMFEIQVFNFQSTSLVPKEHVSSSAWWEWPIAYARPVRLLPTNGRCMLSMYNPIGHIVAFVSFIYSLFTFKGNRLVVGLIFGFLCSWLPFAFIPRAVFFYHYAIPYMILLCLLGLNIEKIKSDRSRSFCSTLLFLSAIAVFAWFYPHYYPDVVKERRERMIVPHWLSVGEDYKGDDKKDELINLVED